MAIVFVFENVYQQYYSEFIASRLPTDYPVIFVGLGKNQPFFLKKSYRYKYVIVRNSLLTISDMIENYRIIGLLREEFNEFGVTDVFLYKDHNYFNVRLIKVLSKTSMSAHLIEEGASMYMLKNLTNIKKHGLLVWIKYRLRQILCYAAGGGWNIEEFGLNPHLKSIHAFDPSFVPKVKSKTKVYLLPNQVWDKKIETDLVSKIVLVEDRDKVGILFLSQPFVFLKRRTLERQLFIVQSIINVVNSLGYIMILKTHPKEDKNMYGTLVGEYKILNHMVEPVELIIPRMNLKAMISEGSSTSITAVRTFGLKSFIVKTDMFDKLEITQFMKLINSYCTLIDLESNGFEVLKKELMDDLMEMNLPPDDVKFETIEKIISK